MQTTLRILAVGSLVAVIAAAMGMCPLWAPVAMLSLALCLQVLK